MIVQVLVSITSVIRYTASVVTTAMTWFHFVGTLPLRVVGITIGLCGGCGIRGGGHQLPCLMLLYGRNEFVLFERYVTTASHFRRHKNLGPQRLLVNLPSLQHPAKSTTYRNHGVKTQTLLMKRYKTHQMINIIIMILHLLMLIN